MNASTLAAALVCAVSCLASGQSPHAALPRPIAYTRTVLPNGLVLLVSEDHSVPLVSVEVSYHVGSMEDTPGRTGFAHLFEHMMAEGSRDLAPGEYKAVIDRAGGFNLGATDPDRQTYRTTIASNMLATVLWMEADRMATLPERMDQARLDAQRAIIHNERLQQFENIPFGTANLFTLATLFPPNHPFHQSPIGTPADLNAATLDQLRAFYRKYYVPNNAVVAISGDVKPATARALAMRYFDPVPRGAPVAHAPAVPAHMATEQRVVLQDTRTTAPRLRMAWPTVGYSDADKFALEALSALLGGERTGRLRHALVLDTQRAVNVRVGHYDNEKNGLFQIDVFARPGTPLTALEQTIDSVLADLPAHPPSSQDVRDYVSRITDSTVVALQPSIERADILAVGEQFAGNPLDYERQLAARARVTPADVVRVARKYLGAGRMVMSMIPAGKLELMSKPSLPYTDLTPRSATVGGAQ